MLRRVAGRRVLLTWDLGGGRGHVVHLGVVAAALARRGHSCVVRLVDLTHASVFAAHCYDVGLTPRAPDTILPGTITGSTYCDRLVVRGFADAKLLAATTEDWRAMITGIDPDLVVADHAPTAILAARSLSIPVIRSGVPAMVPPANMPSFPPILEDDQTKPLADEAQILGAVNAVSGKFGLPDFATLPSVFTADDDVVASLSLLDCYYAYRSSPLLPPVVGAWQDPGERQRSEVFVYLSNRDRFDPVILTALAGTEYPTRIYAAGAPAPTLAIIRRGRAIIEKAPVPPAEIARRARILVHAGNHGMCCLGIRAGLPQVTIGAAAEHVFDGRQLAGQGVGLTVEPRRRTVPNIKAAIAEAWESTAMAERAVAFAEETASEFEGDPGELTADRIEAVLR